MRLRALLEDEAPPLLAAPHDPDVWCCDFKSNHGKDCLKPSNSSPEPNAPYAVLVCEECEQCACEVCVKVLGVEDVDRTADMSGRGKTRMVSLWNGRTPRVLIV